MTDDGRHGKYITTILNTRLYLTDMRPQDLDPRFVACGLARECRWACQLTEFYSVAQHCVVVRDLVDRWYQPTNAYEREVHKPLLLKCALTHDVTEALGLRDVASGFKESDELAGYRRCEKEAADVVATWLNLPRDTPHIVHRADIVVRAAEARDLRRGMDYSDPRPAYDVPTIVPWSTHYAEARWLHEFNALFSTSHRPASPRAEAFFDRLTHGVNDAILGIRGSVA